jgi:hypothetical protein
MDHQHRRHSKFDTYKAIIGVNIYTVMAWHGLVLSVVTTTLHRCWQQAERKLSSEIEGCAEIIGVLLKYLLSSSTLSLHMNLFLESPHPQ